MTFWAGYRAMRSIDPCPKCGGEKTAQRRSRLRFFVARSAEQALSIYRLLYEVQFCFIPLLFYLYNLNLFLFYIHYFPRIYFLIYYS